MAKRSENLATYVVTEVIEHECHDKTEAIQLLSKLLKTSNDVYVRKLEKPREMRKRQNAEECDATK